MLRYISWDQCRCGPGLDKSLARDEGPRTRILDNPTFNHPVYRTLENELLLPLQSDLSY